ncbi:UNVERIFIED_CONTAM: Transcription factor SRM1 [Sesamum radiatum]|uniref:Transcription factor SRM1 n=1 Tax=Sesamum radiatum TaxID=300843 RepID=A0AAW2KB84_SESRA
MTMANTAWSWSDDKIFENALVEFPEGVENRWQKIADCLPGKSPDGVRVHYTTLVYDIGQIESGMIQLPSYSDDDRGNVEQVGSSSVRRRSSFAACPTPRPAFRGRKGKRAGLGRKRNTGNHVKHSLNEKLFDLFFVVWLFLIGLQRYGKSDWRSISRNLLVSRQPQQVASHAQKYFKRLKTATESRKRSSIHDITITDSDCLLLPAPTAPPPVQACFPDFGFSLQQ